MQLAMPIMNPGPTEIVEPFTFVEVTLVQYTTVVGHLPGVSGAAKPKKVNKIEVAHEEPPKGVAKEAEKGKRARLNRNLRNDVNNAFPFLLGNLQI